MLRRCRMVAVIIDLPDECTLTDAPSRSRTKQLQKNHVLGFYASNKTIPFNRSLKNKVSAL
jgi:hypothetical protein